MRRLELLRLTMRKAYMVRGRIQTVACALALAAALPITAQQQDRPPAVPLVTNDPFFSLWSMADKLTDAPTEHWSEAAQPMTGLVRIDGRAYRWMGESPHLSFGTPPVPTMRQTKLEVTPLHTSYTFEQDGVQLRVAFFTPLLPSDLDVMSRPVPTSQNP
jgi:hypothetical protein